MPETVKFDRNDKRLWLCHGLLCVLHLDAILIADPADGERVDDVGVATNAQSLQHKVVAVKPATEGAERYACCLGKLGFGHRADPLFPP